MEQYTMFKKRNTRQGLEQPSKGTDGMANLKEYQDQAAK